MADNTDTKLTPEQLQAEQKKALTTDPGEGGTQTQTPPPQDPPVAEELKINLTELPVEVKNLLVETFKGDVKGLAKSYHELTSKNGKLAARVSAIEDFVKANPVIGEAISRAVENGDFKNAETFLKEKLGVQTGQSVTDKIEVGTLMEKVKTIESELAKAKAGGQQTSTLDVEKLESQLTTVVKQLLDEDRKQTTAEQRRNENQQILERSYDKALLLGYDPEKHADVFEEVKRRVKYEQDPNRPGFYREDAVSRVLLDMQRDGLIQLKTDASQVFLETFNANRKDSTGNGKESKGESIVEKLNNAYITKQMKRIETVRGSMVVKK